MMSSVLAILLFLAVVQAVTRLRGNLPQQDEINGGRNYPARPQPFAIVTGRQAPGDEDDVCLENATRVVNEVVLMRSFNYRHLFKENGGPWSIVDDDPGRGKHTTVSSEIL